MTVAAIYARKSTAQGGDAEDRSVARQVANARAFAESKGWTVDDAHVYVDDGISGAAALKKLRAKQRMLAAIESDPPPFQVLVMQSNDRLSRRDGDEAFGELKAIDRAGVQVWFYADGSTFEHGTLAANTVGFLKAEFAAEWRREIGRKGREALARKASHGYVAGGRRFGYDNVRVDGHTEYRKNPEQAAVVLEIYERYAAGEGLPTIAHALNAKGAAAPQSQRGRVRGWCPSSVREVLRRPLYRGEVVYGLAHKGKKKDERGVRVRSARPQAHGSIIRTPKPELRVVPAALADAVDERFAVQHTRSLRRANGRLLGRPRGEASPYLLVGLLQCGICGGGMEVLSSTRSGGRRVHHYRCYVARRKGAACCTNRQPAHMAETDAAVLRAVQDTLLHPDVVESALAHAERELARDRNAGDREALEKALAQTEKAMNRLSAAVAEGGELPALLDALQTQERQRAELSARLAALNEPAPELDPAAVRAELRGYLRDWTGFLRGHTTQAQAALRRLIAGRLTLTPNAAGYYEFAGVGTVRPLLAGVIRNLASPARSAPAYLELPLRGTNRQAA